MCKRAIFGECLSEAAVIRRQAAEKTTARHDEAGGRRDGTFRNLKKTNGAA